MYITIITKVLKLLNNTAYCDATTYLPVTWVHASIVSTALVNAGVVFTPYVISKSELMSLFIGAFLEESIPNIIIGPLRLCNPR